MGPIRTGVEKGLPDFEANLDHESTKVRKRETKQIELIWPHRFFAFFFSGGKLIITNAFVKKSDKLPPGEKERALRCMKDYEQRVKEGRYYVEK